MHSKALLDGFAVFRKHSFARHLFAAAKHNNAVPPVRLRAGGKASSALRGSRGTSDVSKYHATAAASRLFSPAHSSRATDAAGIYSNGFNSTTAATEPSWNASSTFSPPTTGSVCVRSSIMDLERSLSNRLQMNNTHLKTCVTAPLVL